jgi:exonuclease SbcC
MDTHAYEQANAHYMLEIDRLERLTENARARQQEAKTAQKTLTNTFETCEQQLRELELPAALDRHLRDMATLRQELDQAQLECAALADSPDELLRLQQAEEQIEQRLKALEQRHIALEKERVTIQQELDQQHQQLAALPQQAILDRAREEQAELEANLALWNRQLAELDDVDERLRSLQAELTALDDPRVRVRQAHSIADNRPKLEQQLGEQQQRQQALDDQHADLMGQLAQYDQLDRNLQTQREQKLTHEAAYQRYLAYKAEAGKLAERKQEVDSIDIEVTRLTDEMKHWQAQYDALCSDYDAAEHTQLSERKQQLESEYVASCASLAEKQKQLEGLERELKQLQALEAQKAETDREVKSIEQQASVLQYFRSQMREAGPHIRKRLVQSISAQAQDYFGDILDDRSHRLVWDPDTYDICVEYSGETRTFNMLSGGEQMSAALAVRLALLTQMTSIRFMFLDEPTTNLDERRRGLLADKLGQIPAIRQLFVISHDSTFQHMDAHTVLVSKFNGISEVS